MAAPASSGGATASFELTLPGAASATLLGSARSVGLAATLWHSTAPSAPLLLCARAPGELLAALAGLALGALDAQEGTADRAGLTELLAETLVALRAVAPTESLLEMLRAHTDEAQPRLVAAARAAAVSLTPMHLQRRTALARAAEEGSARSLFHFGGQGVAYLPELQRVFLAFPAVVVPLVTAASAALQHACSDARLLTDASSSSSPPPLARYYTAQHGIDVLAWLSSAVHPPDEYLRSAPLSFPLIGLTQLCHYAVLLHVSGAELDYSASLPSIGPSAAPFGSADLGALGAVGHSQGIVAAVAAMAAGSASELLEATVSAVTLLFWQGARMQQAFDALPQSAILVAAKPGTEEPQAMLSVSGLSPAQLAEHVATASSAIVKAEAAALGEAPTSRPVAPLTISLVNGLSSAVISGRPAHVAFLLTALDKVRAPPGVDQARVPHSQRKPVLRTSFLHVSAPFHSPLLAAAVDLAIGDCRRAGLRMPRSSLRAPVYNTHDGRDLRTSASLSLHNDDGNGVELIGELIRLQTTLPLDWPATLRSALGGCSGLSHVLDLGPGGASSAARLTARFLQGSGIAVVLANFGATASADGDDDLSAQAAGGSEGLPLFSLRLALSSSPMLFASAHAPDWAAAHGPRLVRRASDKALLLDTAFSRLLGRPPVMVAGMTPCTSYYGTPLVAACANAGFHAELACGGLPRPVIFRERIARLQAQLAPGQGIALNMLYLNSRQWGFQFPLACEMAKEGVPIESVCIAAGVPSLDTGVAIVRALAQAGIRFVAFKPGSIDAILRVTELAAAVAPFTVVMQWTGGRGGGHHSFEDVHAPIAATYALVRRQANVVLVVGSGLGSAACALPWLTGEWSVTRGLSHARMPFDGVLLASRIMVAHEAATSFEVKQLLVDTDGIDGERESEWEQTYEGVAGGILTVKSELGEPIHKVANRGMLLWRDLDRRVFNLPRGPARAAAVAKDKAAIIARLNDDYQKVFFGRTEQGAVVDAALMTYAEVAARMVALMFVQPAAERPEFERPHEEHTQWGRWIDVSFRDRVFAFLQRSEATLRGTAGGASTKPLLVVAPTQLDPGSRSVANLHTLSAEAGVRFDNPAEFVSHFFIAYPLGHQLVLSSCDFDSWLEDCRSRGKPVPFVPVVDGDLENWFKKDSLWYSEDLAAVPERDAGRVAILQGPVAVRHSRIVDEPAAEILNGVHDGLCRALLSLPQGAAARVVVPTVVDAFGGVLNSVQARNIEGRVLSSITTSGDSTTISFELDRAFDLSASAEPLLEHAGSPASALSEVCALLQRDIALLASGSSSWLAWVLALLVSPSVVSRELSGAWRWAPNPARAVFALGPGRALVVRLSGSVASIAGGAASAPLPVAATVQLVDSASSAPLATAMELQGSISLVVHDARPATSDAPAEPAPLCMTLEFRPAESYAPLVLMQREWQAEVRRYYAGLWFSSERDRADIEGLDMSGPLTATFVATASDIEAFCDAVGLARKSARPASDGPLIAVAPTSFAIVAGWRALIKCLFPRAISGDILKLVHLSNSFSLAHDSAQHLALAQAPLLAGECVSSILSVTEVLNSASGKVVTVEGLLSRSGRGVAATAPLPWVRVRSQFLFRGPHTDHSLCFRSSPPEGTAFEMDVATPAAAAVLASKPWFVFEREIVAGDRLRFVVHSREQFADESVHLLRSVRVTGDIFLTSGAGASRAGTVDFAHPVCSASGPLAGNPVLAYLSRACSSKHDDDVVLFESGGRTLLPEPDVARAPLDNLAYAVASRDLNPIHRNATIASLAGLPTTIVHGMWTSANGMRAVQAALDLELGNKAGSGGGLSFESERMVRTYAAQFVGLVLPGDRVVTQVSHIGMHRPTGRRIISIASTAVRAATGACESVLTATAHVEQLPTAYVFTGQGSTSVGMGMELYASSQVARRVWDTADTHLADTYGFSILSIVRSNPRALTVHFGGRRGAAIRRNYMALETEAPDGSGPRPLLAAISDETDSYTFQHPEGLLFATQFTQPALVLTEKAAFDDMCAHGLVPPHALFAGHSLGEYAALASAVPLLPVPILVGVTFLRGMVMQGAVPRDAEGRSDFGMVACNPQRVGPFFTEEVMHSLVAAIAKHSSTLLEVVNFNVSDRQYVVAGHLQALDVLSHALGLARSDPQAAASNPAALLKRAFALTERRIAEAAAAGRKLAPERGEATIPLPGVDVPFHSRFLLGGVIGFRNVLRKQLTVESFRRATLVERMVGCYVPNLVALPFSLERYFAVEVVRRTGSPDLAAAVASDAAWAEASADRAAYARTLVIELLAYQFASPVQWIATQHFFFRGEVLLPDDAETGLYAIPASAADSPALVHHRVAALGVVDPSQVAGIRRLVEIGPAMTLVGMAARTLELARYSGTAAAKRREVLWYGKDSDVLYCTGEPAGPSASDFAAALVASQQPEATATPSFVSLAAEVASVPVVPVTAVLHRPSAPAGASTAPPPPDEPVTALEVLQAMLAVKLSQPLASIRPDSTIKALVGGKSAVQNEILGELEKEFGAGPDGGAEMPLAELARAVSRGYKPLGKVSSALVTKMLGAKLPGGFGAGQARAYLTSSRLLGPGRSDAVLVHALSCQPPARLSSEAEATFFLDTVVEGFGAHKGLDLSRAALGGGGSGGDVWAGLSPELLAALLGAGSGSSSNAEGSTRDPVPDAPPQPIEFLRTLLAVKLSQPLASIRPEASIKALVGGKSAVQNEILGELEKEFGAGCDGGAEMPLAELARAAGGMYKGLGKVGVPLVNKLVSAKFPGGFGPGDIRSHLMASRGLGAGRSDSVLLFGAAHQPAGRLASEAEARAWLDTTADAFAQEYSVDFGCTGVRRSGTGTGNGTDVATALAGLLGGAAGGSSDKSAALEAFQKRVALLVEDQVAAYETFASHDAHAPLRHLEASRAAVAQSDAALAVWRAEHSSGGSDAYEAGIRPSFDARKQRSYSSAWAWGLQQLHTLLHHAALPAVLSGTVPGSLLASLSPSSALVLANRACAETHVLCASIDRRLRRALAASATASRAIPPARSLPLLGLEATALDDCDFAPLCVLRSRESGRSGPVYAAAFASTAPRVRIVSSSGKVVYEEVPRPGVPTSRAYVVEMARGSPLLDEVLAQPLALYPDASAAQSLAVASPLPFVHMRSTDPLDSGSRVMDADATRELFRALLSLTSDLSEASPSADSSLPIQLPLGNPAGCPPPPSFAHKVALVTGCGPGSIGLELIRALLTGGATVVATTSRLSLSSATILRRVYEDCAAVGSRLFVLPFNQGSQQDVAALVAHVYVELKLDLDFVVPFAAIPEQGREVDSLDGSSDLAHRLMLTNVIRLLGCVASAKRARSISTHPALALIPLSPNHGVFGADGLYAESKLGLEALQHKWASEGWGDFVSIAGAVIGWTRGTGLMAGNNVVSEGVEALGCRTFSQAEMALNLLALLHPRMVQLAANGPLWADFRGGFHAVPDLKAATQKIRGEIKARASLARAVVSDAKLDVTITSPTSSGTASTSAATAVHVRLVEFPSLPSPARLAALSLKGALTSMLDLDRTVVVTGFGEVCPWGNARTRWEMESAGEFSIEGAVLLAWITGRIRYAGGSVAAASPHPGGPGACGWVDAATSEPVAEGDIKARYEKDLLAHAGIRVLEPDKFDGYDPKNKLFLHQVALDRDMSWIEVPSRADADEYLAQLGADKVDVRQDSGEGGAWRIRLRRGAVISVPKALRFDRWVAGQVPLGWDAARFGVPADMIGRMDPVVLYSLVAVSEALLSAGITDAYEFFKYVHVSDVGNACGGGMGGMTALRRIFRHRFQEGDMPSDTLQESFINTVPAWINMLLLSASGPIKTPVGACATAAESVDIGVDTILAGKASIMIVGGVDDFCEEGSYEFAQMGATSSSAEEERMGREPAEMCRPMAPSRGGFMEAQGAGMQVLMTARLALAMGVPVYGVIALSTTATDKNGRSIPAPGQGVLTSAREAAPLSPLQQPLLDLSYRRRRLSQELAHIDDWRRAESAEVAAAAAGVAADAASAASADAAESAGRLAAEQFTCARLSGIEREATLLESSARRRWCADYWLRDPAIAPLRGALSMFGLTVDDITVGSFHGTGTHANDLNESDVTNAQMAHLGRTPGQPLFVVAQKHLTGHPKGAAAAWMLNGALQMLNSGIVPGNRNGDDIDEDLRGFSHLAFLSRPLRLGEGGVRAVLVKSFGFGQAGGEVLVVHPDFLLASLEPAVLSAYIALRRERERAALRHAQEVLAGSRKLVGVKAAPPYTKAQEQRVYLDPLARARRDAVMGEFTFHDADLGPIAAAAASLPLAWAPQERDGAQHAVALRAGVQEATTRTLAAGSLSRGAPLGVGVDVEPQQTFRAPSELFLSRNFTPAEIAYCSSAADPAASFAGRWAAKEAVFKALSAAAGAAVAGSEGLSLPGGGAGLLDIEVLPSFVPVSGASVAVVTSGAPQVQLAGRAASLAARAGVAAGSARVTISHAGDFAVAVAMFS